MPKYKAIKPPAIVWRHRRENRKKCSLRGLESHPDFAFTTYPSPLPPLPPHTLLLAVDAPPPLQNDETFSALLVLDGTWTYAARMKKALPPTPPLIERSLPPDFVTAYPRCQNDCPLPSSGLATVEAIYLAYRIMGWEVDDILAHYYWRDAFLEKNAQTLQEYPCKPSSTP